MVGMGLNKTGALILLYEIKSNQINILILLLACKFSADQACPNAARTCVEDFYDENEIGITTTMGHMKPFHMIFLPQILSTLYARNGDNSHRS